MMETEQNNIYIFITTAIDEFPNSTAIFRRDQQTFDYPIPDKINIIQKYWNLYPQDIQTKIVDIKKMKDNLDSLSVDIQNVLSVSYIIDSIQSKRGGKTRKFLEQERIIYPRPPKITKVLNNKELMEKLFVEYISEFHNHDIKKTTNEILQTILSDYKNDTPYNKIYCSDKFPFCFAVEDNEKLDGEISKHIKAICAQIEKVKNSNNLNFYCFLHGSRYSSDANYQFNDYSFRYLDNIQVKLFHHIPSYIEYRFLCGKIEMTDFKKNVVILSKNIDRIFDKIEKEENINDKEKDIIKFYVKELFEQSDDLGKIIKDLDTNILSKENLMTILELKRRIRDNYERK